MGNEPVFDNRIFLILASELNAIHIPLIDGTNWGGIPS